MLAATATYTNERKHRTFGFSSLFFQNHIPTTAIKMEGKRMFVVDNKHASRIKLPRFHKYTAMVMIYVNDISNKSSQ